MHPLVPEIPELRDILPEGAAASAATLDAAADAQASGVRFAGIPLPDGLGCAVPKRKLQFAAGRYCARVAISNLGLDAGTPLARDRDNVPIWPAGLVGSISHTDDVAWAAAARGPRVVGLGIDVESLEAASRAGRLEQLICCPDELELGCTTGLGRGEFLTLVFSFKESLFKCVFPLARRFFGYRDAALTRIDLRSRVIEARLATTVSDAFPDGLAFRGGFVLSRTHVFTCVHLTLDGHELRAGGDAYPSRGGKGIAGGDPLCRNGRYA